MIKPADMDRIQIALYVLAAVALWLTALSFYLIKTLGQYKKLTKGATGINLNQLIENLAKKSDLDSKRINQLTAEVTKLENQNLQNFQKYAIIRFNPFEDTGGDQSFVAAFLDGENNGVVISSLHSRATTRVYAKPVSKGQAQNYQFSKEEKEAVDKALRKK
ncbi:MAG TPA: DUF4446 family protein [Candidatus Saccharimonadales bacterium]|nr:DUF4446 family protein [Candidatus Saccharimonadales bacterium]